MEQRNGSYYLVEKFDGGIDDDIDDSIDYAIVDINKCIEIESIENGFGYETLFETPPNFESVFKFNDFELRYILLSVDEFDNKKIEILNLEETIKWCIKNELNELFENEFKEIIDLTDLKLIN